MPDQPTAGAVVGADPAADRGSPDPAVRIMLRPMASPLPLGFFAFGIGSTLFTVLQLGWVGIDQTPVLATIMAAFVAPLEVIPAVIAFWARDVGGATALGVFGMTWGAAAAIMLTGTPGETSPMFGVFMITVGAVIVLLAVAALPSKPVLGGLLLLSCARFVLTGVYQAGGPHAWELASGWIGFPLAAAALYFGLALMLEDAQRSTVLPLARRGRARSSLETHLGGQVDAIEREAGVRSQL
jgi:uncharacterized protein